MKSMRSRVGWITGWIGLGLVLNACGGDSQATKSPAPATTAAAQISSNGDPRAGIFLAKGCPQCHSISAFEIKSPTDVGPDLAQAATDVQARFGMKLEEFLEHPTGTMMVVLSSQIHLTEVERDSIVAILKAVNQGKGGSD